VVSGQERRCAPIQFFSTCRYLAPTARLSNFVKVVQKWLGTNTFVRIKSHTGSKFSGITLWQLYTWGMQLYTHITVFLCGVRWRHSRTPTSEPYFWSFCSILRKDNIANYGSIWTQFSTFVRGIARRALQRTKRFVAMSISGAERFANVRRKFSKT